jgi:ribosome biogenesis protein UTP30
MKFSRRQSINSSPMAFHDSPLGSPIVSKAVKGLLSHNDSDALVYLQVTVKKPLVNSKQFMPRLIPLKHRVKKASQYITCLIVRDPHVPYKQLLEDPDSSTHKVFEEIVGVKKLKSKLASKKIMKQFENTYDLVLVEHEVAKFLPQFLPKSFYSSGKLFPIPIEVGKRKGVHDKRSVDPDLVKAEIKRVTKCGVMAIVPGTCLSVCVGRTDMEDYMLKENIEFAIDFITNKVISKGWGNICMFHIKTPHSVALPVFQATE